MNAVDLHKVATRHLEQGWQPLPLPPRKKTPPPEGFTGWRGQAVTPADWDRWLNDGTLVDDANLAVRMPPGVIGIDVDHYGDKHGADTIAALEHRLGLLPPTYATTSRPNTGAGIWYYRVPVGTTLRTALADVELIQPHHRYAVVGGSHPEGRPYLWYDRTGAELDIEDVPHVDDLAALPWAWVEELRTTVYGRPVDVATTEQARAFIAQHIDASQPAGLKGLRTQLNRRTKGRHDTLIAIACEAMREAAAGCYTAEDAIALLASWWLEVIDDPARRRIDGGEFADAMLWAIAQAENEPDRVDELRARRASRETHSGTTDDDARADSAVVLPASFWDERLELAHIRTAAFSRMISPDAVLACVLARVVALTHHQFVLPDIVGRVGSLNLDVAIVAPSGGGKGSASDTSADLVTAPNLLSTALAGEFREISAGSGEGLVRAFFKRKKVKDEEGKSTTATVQTCWNALVRIDEGEMLARLAKRQDQTTMTVIRQAWSGERLGASYADDDKNLHIDAHGYRLSIVMGVQPELGRFLLDDIASGTPQRFTFLSGRHPDIPNPDHLPAWPSPLRWTPVSRPPDAHGLHAIGVVSTVAHEIRVAQHLRVTGATDDAYGGHAGLRRLKVAAALAVLAQRINVTDDDWRLAGIIETTSIGHLPVGRTGGYEACWYCCSHSRGGTSLRVL